MFCIAWTWKLPFHCDFMTFVLLALISKQQYEMLNVYQCSSASKIGWNETQSLLFSLERLFWWLVSVWMEIILEGSGPDRCWCLSGSMVTLWISSVVRSQSTVMQKNKYFLTRFCLKPNSLRAQPPFSLLLYHITIDKHRKLPWRFCTHCTYT